MNEPEPDLKQLRTLGIDPDNLDDALKQINDAWQALAAWTNTMGPALEAIGEALRNAAHAIALVQDTARRQPQKPEWSRLTENRWRNRGR